MLPRSVVPECEPVSEADYRAALLTGLSRCSRTPAGKRALAAEMDLSSKGLENVLLRDAMPSGKRQWDATRACPGALDDIAALYGFELIRADQAATDTVATLPLATLLAQVAEAESPASPGGVIKTHAELLAMEASLRAVHRLTGGMLEEISRIRAPRVVGVD